MTATDGQTDGHGSAGPRQQPGASEHGVQEIDVRGLAIRLGQNVEKVIVGKHFEVQLTLMALLCQGHVLVEDVPGVGKTMLAKSIARSLGCSFKRIQFTPDLLPSDVTGVSIYNQK